jgi:CheY-like chemotaxis protein
VVNSATRPRIVILGGPDVPAGDLIRALERSFEVTVASRAAAPGILALGSADYVISPSGDVPSLSDALGISPWKALAEGMPEGVAIASATGEVTWSNGAYQTLPPEVRERVERLARDSAAADAEVRRSIEVPGAAGSQVYEVVVSRLLAVDAPPTHRISVLVHNLSPTRRRQQRLETIEQAGCELFHLDADAVRGMNASERLEWLQGRIMRLCHDLLDFDHCAIRLIDERTGKLELVMSWGLSPEASELQLYRSEEGSGISGYVAATGRSYVAMDCETDPRFLPGLTGARSSLTVPLLRGSSVVGTLDVESAEPAAFDDEDRLFAEVFGRYVALALHMLDLLVVERSTVNERVSERVRGEIAGPLSDIAREVDWLHRAAAHNPELGSHVEQIRRDVEAIRRRVQEVAAGPRTLLGVEHALAHRAPEPGLVGKRVLVADDEPTILRIMHDVLRNRGCAVETRSDGASAIRAVTDAAAAGAPFDLVISDIKLPDHNGYEVFSASRRALPRVPVILMTGFGYDPHHSIVRASQEGLQCVLFKPFEVERLLENVRKALGAPAARS